MCKPTDVFSTPSRNPAFLPSEKEFHIRQLPRIMRSSLRWPMSAALMEQWFSLPEKQFTDKEKDGETKPRDMPRQNIDTQLITWKWLKQFERVQQAEAILLKSLNTPNAQNILAEKIRKNRDIQTLLLNKAPIDINNNPQMPIELHSDWQFQFTQVGYRFSQMDDLYGALGNFMLCAAVTKARLDILRPGVARLSISEIGLYARDTFDFNDKQYLGHWSEYGFGLHIFATANNFNKWDWDLPDWRMPGWHPKLGWTKPVHNSDFQTYRQWTKCGGDLLLFSDVKTIPVKIDLEVKL